jgi:hypothetical protein
LEAELVIVGLLRGDVRRAVLLAPGDGRRRPATDPGVARRVRRR